MIEEVAAVSGPLKKYRVVRNGFETVMKLSDADAEKLGAGPYDVVGASTIEPVTLATDGSGADDGAPAVPANPAVVMVDVGGHVGPGMADGVPGPEPVQPPSDPGDGQEQEGAQPPTDDDPQVHPAAPEPQPTTEPQPAPPVKAPAKKRTAAANKARTGAENKAGG